MPQDLSYPDARAKEIIRRYDGLKSRRSSFWENHWQDIRELVMPDAGDLTRTNNPGQRQADMIFDDTAVYACKTLADGLQAYLCNPKDRWFFLSLHPQFAPLMEDDDVLAYLEIITDLIYFQYTLDTVKHKQAMHEAFMELGGFGTANIFQDFSQRSRTLSFVGITLGDYLIDENDEGMVDAVYRTFPNISAKKLIQMFNGQVPDTVTQQAIKDDSKTYTMLHAVFPRMDYDPLKVDSQNMPNGSFWVLKEEGRMIKEGGFNDFPYQVSRWTKRSNEVYGRSPAMTCLPSIKMINSMSKVMIVHAEKQAAPPWIFPSDGFMAPIRTGPDEFSYKDAGVENPFPLVATGANPQLTLEIMNQTREHIRRCFFVDWLQTQKMNVEMTASEYLGRQEEQLSLMAPMLGRQESELLGPMIKRSYRLLRRNGMLPPIPPQLIGAKMDIQYVSPAARAQMGLKWRSMTRWIQDLVPLAQINPEVLDAVNTDEYARLQARYQDVTRKIVRSQRDIDTIRQGRKQQAAMQQAAAAAPQVAGAAKDFAQAKLYSSQAQGNSTGQGV